MKRRISFIFLIAPLLLCSCATQLSTLQRQAIETEYVQGDYDTIFRAVRTVFQNEGYAVEQSDLLSGFLLFSKGVRDKNPAMAFGLGILPGGGSFYVRSYGLGVFSMLTWPFSVLWDPAVSAVKASDMYKTVKVSVTLTDLEDRTELRTGFTGIKTTEEYGITMKRMYAEVRRQALMREVRTRD